MKSIAIRGFYSLESDTYGELSKLSYQNIVGHMDFHTSGARTRPPSFMLFVLYPSTKDLLDTAWNTCCFQSTVSTEHSEHASVDLEMWICNFLVVPRVTGIKMNKRSSLPNLLLSHVGFKFSFFKL